MNPTFQDGSIQHALRRQLTSLLGTCSVWIRGCGLMGLIILTSRYSKEPDSLPTRGLVLSSKLSSVEDVKELHAELKTKPLVGSESGSFEYREVKIINPISPQPRIHTLHVPKSEVSWRRKACCIEPS